MAGRVLVVRHVVRDFRFGRVAGLAPAGTARLLARLRRRVRSADATCDDCFAGQRENAAVGYLNLGGTLNDHLLLGAEISGWSKEEEGVTLNLYNVLATLTVHPQPSSGFFLKVGAGGAFMDTDIHAVSKTITVDLGNGLGLLAGARYDIWLWKNVSLTPGVNFWYGRKFASDKSPGTWTPNVVDVTLGLTFH